MNQLHMQKFGHPEDLDMITEEEKKQALECLMLLNQRQCKKSRSKDAWMEESKEYIIQKKKQA